MIPHSDNSEKYYAKIQRQLDILYDHLTNHCRDENEKIEVRSMINNLKHPQMGTITKSELASQYSISIRTLNRRMKDKDGLLNDLYDRFGYHRWRKYLFPAEVELIHKHLGPPPTNLIK